MHYTVFLLHANRLLKRAGKVKKSSNRVKSAVTTR